MTKDTAGRLRQLLDAPELYNVVDLTVATTTLRLLLDIATEAEGLLRNGDGYDVERLCVFLGKLHGQDGHDWGEWSEPRQACDGNWWRGRSCKRCGECGYAWCDATPEA